jgi:folate-binding protein YgfZ
LKLEDSFLVLNDPQTHEKVLNYLFPFSYAGDFKVEDVSDSYRTISLQGPRSLLVMKETCFEPLPTLSEHDWVRTLVAGHSALVVKASHTGEIGFDILIPSSAVQDVWDFILLKGTFHSISAVGLRALDSLRIEAGIPIYGRDVDETNMLLEVGLADAVSFSKGCYTGQEAVAMATYRGHVSKQLSGLALDGDLIPAHGDTVKKSGKEIGLVTSALRSPTLGSVIALAYLKYGFSEPCTSVEVQVGSETMPALVADLPFFTRV